MARIDAYLRSLERFNARGMVLQSNQNIVLRLADGDRPAAQSVPHDQLVAMVREVAPTNALVALDSGRGTQFMLDAGGGKQLSVQVQVKQGVWAVTIDQPGGGSAPAASASNPGGQAAASPAVPVGTPGPMTAFEPEAMGAMVIERTGYEEDVGLGIAMSSSSFLEDIGRAARGQQASDVYLSAGVPPLVRIAGQLAPLSGFGAVDEDTLSRELSATAPTEMRMGAHNGTSSTFVVELGQQGRFRLTMFQDAAGLGAVMRLLPAEVPDATSLGLPAAMPGLTATSSGLLLVCGPMGSGKSTTRAALTKLINQTRRSHVVVVDTAREFSHKSHASFVSQRLAHEGQLEPLLREVDREGPDVVCLPVLRGAEHWRHALQLADNGALVIVECEARSVAAALEEIFVAFPAHDRAVVARKLARVFAGGSAQQLARKSGGGRVAVFEYVPAVPAVLEALANQEVSAGWAAIMQGARAQGAVTLEAAMADAAARGVVATPERARSKGGN